MDEAGRIFVTITFSAIPIKSYFMNTTEKAEASFCPWVLGVLILYPIPRLKFKKAETREWKENWVHLRKSSAKIFQCAFGIFLLYAKCSCGWLPTEKHKFLNLLCILHTRPELILLPGYSGLHSDLITRMYVYARQGDKWGFDPNHGSGPMRIKTHANKRKKIHTAIILCQSLLPMERRISSRKGPEEGRKGRKPLPFMLHTKIINQNINPILRGIMEFTVNIKYLKNIPIHRPIWSLGLSCQG